MWPRSGCLGVLPAHEFGLKAVDVQVADDRQRSTSQSAKLHNDYSHNGHNGSSLFNKHGSGEDLRSFHLRFDTLEEQLSNLAEEQRTVTRLLRYIQEDLKLGDAAGKSERLDCRDLESPLHPGHVSWCLPRDADGNRTIKWAPQPIDVDMGEAAPKAAVATPSHNNIWGSVGSRRSHGQFQPTSPALSCSTLGDRPAAHAMPDGTKDALKRAKSSRGIGQLQTAPPSVYKQDGWAARLVQSPNFELLSLGVIAFNAIWIAVDTDLNKADLLVHADIQYQIVENAFCVYFVAEWLIRFNAFRTCCMAFRDPWFSFDSILVCLMVVETWVMSVVVLAHFSSDSAANLGSTSFLKMLRLLRLTRLSRMVRLLRSLPELLFMLRGVVAATRSVGCTLGMLLGAVYIYGIAFTQLSEGTDFGAKYFRNVPDSMYTLLLDGAFMDSTKNTMNAIREESYVCLVLFGLVILTAHLTIMNMLIGVLCDVVTKVSTKEKEDMDYAHVKEKLAAILKAGGFKPEDEELTISKEEFLKLIKNEQALELLEGAGVDSVVLLDFADFFFQSDKFGRKFDRRVTFEEFVELIMKLRQGNAAALRDVAELRKYVRDECLGLKVTLAFIKEGQRRIEAKLPPGK